MIVLRGDLAAILTFASGKKKLEFLNEKAILEALMGRARTIEGQKRKKPAMRAFGHWHFGKIGCGGRIFPVRCFGQSSGLSDRALLERASPFR
ncbi:hypothetical protein, partial [Rhizobium sp. AP16]|uniref:hypothetical protein n=1 Tax=Rhizobium sp. AP16 TaxID=1144306 RepID=UPI00026ECEBE